MRVADAIQESAFTVATLDDFVSAGHPLRSIRTLVNDALAALSARFNVIYADNGRDSIAPGNSDPILAAASVLLDSQ